MTDDHGTADRTRQPVARKAYYSIGEVCELTGLKPHVLRYWESQFRILQPGKNQAGNRVYRPREIKVVVLLKHILYTRKFTIEGAKQRLEELRNEETIEERLDGVLPAEFLTELKEELVHLLATLTPPATTAASSDEATSSAS